MKIYVQLPASFISSGAQIRSELHSVLEKYYGSFSASDIELFMSADESPDVCVMEKAASSDSYKNIIDDINKIFGCRVDVRLNYQKIDPNFRPSGSPLDYVEAKDDSEEDEIQSLSWNYTAEEPDYAMDQLVLPQDTREEIEEAVSRINDEVKRKVLMNGGLRKLSLTQYRL